MTLSPTFQRRFQEARLLELGGEEEAALTAYSCVFDPFEDATERRVASAEFCIKVELAKARLQLKLGRADLALGLLEDDWMWRLVNEVDEDSRSAFFQAYGVARTTAGAPWRADKGAILQRLEQVALGPHRVRGWDTFLERLSS